MTVRRFAFLVAAMAPLWASALVVAAGLHVEAPDTAHAARSSDVIERAVRALTVREGESRITQVWVFPTGHPDAVFVHYRTKPDAEGAGAGDTHEHLVLLEMDGERIATLRDLTNAPASVIATMTGRSAGRLR